MSGTLTDDGEPAPISIRRVTDDQGHTLTRNSLVRVRVLQPWQASLETSILQQVIARGTGAAAAIGRPAAGKTGTTTNYADAWFCGYTPDLSAAVWVGYPASQKPMVVRGIRVAGGTFPAQIWSSFASAALTGVPAHGFPAFTTPATTKRIVCPRTGDLATQWCPERIACLYFVGDAPTLPCTFHGPRLVTLPDLRGLSVTVARSRLARLRFATQVVEVPGDPGEQGTVLSQSPGAGRAALQGTKVTLSMDSGPLFVVPDVMGQYRGAAQQALHTDGFATTVSYDGATDASAPLGTVISEDPTAGSTSQGIVKIVVHGTDVTVTAPNVVGLSTADAQATLAAAGLGAGVATGGADGTVVAQSPAAGASLEIGALVALTLTPPSSLSP
jgi:membrane peptidoglycan carboxypeptidase